MDLTTLSWAIPLIAGAALTFFFGWLDSTLKYRRAKRDTNAELVRHAEERKFTNSREHAHRALALASEIRDLFTTGDGGSALGYDWARLRDLNDLLVLLPSPELRGAVQSCAMVISSAEQIANWRLYAETPAQLQRDAVTHLRELLGAYLREDDLPDWSLQWAEEMSLSHGQALSAQYEARRQALLRRVSE